MGYARDSMPGSPDVWTTIRVPIELRTRLKVLRAKATNGETMYQLIALGLDALEQSKGARVRATTNPSTRVHASGGKG